jgi:hypothetical protein
MPKNLTDWIRFKDLKTVFIRDLEFDEINPKGFY